MQLHLEHIVPRHLGQRLAAQPSHVWDSSLHIAGGSQVLVQAPSGAGKTTLVHMLYGLRRDYEGSIRWDSVSPATATDAALSQLRANDVGIVFQDLRLFPVLTAWQNVLLKMQLSNAASEQEVNEWLRRLGIYDKRDEIAANLSYGEQQRVAIVRALVQPFSWLLMDEPFSHLDTANRRQAIALISEVAGQRKAGLILSGLDDNNYFDYTHRLML